MTYLFEVASAHNNIRDKDNLYSNKQISNKIYKLWPGGSIRFDYAFSAQVIKELALYNNHIKEGSGMAILKYTNVLKSDLKVVLKKYNLPVSGTNATLIKRIENNLTINQINQEFPGSRYILTDDGINFCKNSYAYFNIIHCIPFNFTIDEYILLCELNKDVSPEEILFCLAAEDWFDYSDIDNFNIFRFEKERDFVWNLSKAEIEEEAPATVHTLQFSISSVFVFTQGIEMLMLCPSLAPIWIAT